MNSSTINQKYIFFFDAGDLYKVLFPETNQNSLPLIDEGFEQLIGEAVPSVVLMGGLVFNPVTSQRKVQGPLSEEMKTELEIKALNLAFKLQNSTQDKFLSGLWLLNDINLTIPSHTGDLFCYQQRDMIKERYFPLNHFLPGHLSYMLFSIIQ